MNWISKAKEEEFSTVRVKPLRKSLTVTHQIGRSSMPRDKARKALAPGKRISASGKTYWETRKNRTDFPGTKI